MARQYLAEKALLEIEQAIVSGELAPNQRLIESDLSKKLDMSRTPVREALKKLEIIGYATSCRSGGLKVSELLPNQIRSLYEVREALHTKAIKLACERATEEQLLKAEECHAHLARVTEEQDAEQFGMLNSAFHENLFTGCGNKQLLRLIRDYRDRYFDRRLERSFSNEDWRIMGMQHASILSVVKQRNAQLAEKLVQEHLRTAMGIALEKL